MSCDSTFLMARMGLIIEGKNKDLPEKKLTQLNPPNLASEKNLSMENILLECIPKLPSKVTPRS